MSEQALRGNRQTALKSNKLGFLTVHLLNLLKFGVYNENTIILRPSNFLKSSQADFPSLSEVFSRYYSYKGLKGKWHIYLLAFSCKTSYFCGGVGV